MNKKHLIVAITGGIGSGKTYFTQILKEKGFSVISCDKIARDIFEYRSIKKKLKKLFPSAVSGKIFLKVNRKKLSDVVFIDKDALNRLNALTHPVIIEKAVRLAKKLPAPVFVEVPLLFEAECERYFNKTVVIVRNKDERLKSVIDRTNLTEEEVLNRMANQVDYDKIDLSPYIVIKNDGDKDSLKSQLYPMLQKLYE